MEINAVSLHRQANELLGAQGTSPKKWSLIHTIISLGATLLTTTIGFLLRLQIANTGGLSGMGTRTMLSTVQSVLELAVLLLLPFWEIGILRAALGWRKSEQVGFSHLTEGFRRFGSVLSTRVWSGALYIAVCFAIFYFSSFLFLMTPWAGNLEAVYAQLPQVSTVEELLELMTPELTAQLAPAMIPMFVIFGVLIAAVYAYLFYRMRFADFFVMEGDSGVKAIVKSFRLTQGNCLQLLKLDLHFWWFYLLQGLSVVLSYGDALLTTFGITLPLGPDGNFFLFYILGITLQTILFWQLNAQRLTTYCVAFDTFRGPAATELPQKM